MAVHLETGTEQIEAEVADGVVWVTLNNLPKHNAITAAMFKGLGVVAEIVNADPSMRCVVVRGAGPKSFASGADIGQLDSGDLRAGSGANEVGAQPPSLGTITKPVIAMIHGYCIGGGLVLALECDIRVATPNATFAIPAAKLGVAYPVAASRRLSALIGPGRASDLLLSARTIDGTEAERIGLVDRLVAIDDLHDVVSGLAQTIASTAPLAHAAHKAQLLYFEHPVEDRLAAMQKTAHAAWASEDFVEGRRAFLERRPPAFKGR